MPKRAKSLAETAGLPVAVAVCGRPLIDFLVKLSRASFDWKLLVMFVLENSMSRSISSLNLTCDSLIVAFVAFNAIGSFLTICLEFDFECVDFDGCEERFVWV